jgi:predicted kinase
MMSGLSGSGKSTIAKALAQKIEAIHLRSDAIRKHLAGIDLMQRGDDSLYSPEMTKKTYGELLNLGILLASRGFSVILDAKYDRQNLRSEVIYQANAHQIPLEIIYCHADVDILKQRLSDRTAANTDIADATTEILATQKFEEFTDSEKAYLTEQS